MTPDPVVRRGLLATALLLAATALLGWVVAAGPVALDASLAGSVIRATPRVVTDAFDTLASLPVVILIGVLAAIDRVTRDRRPMAAAMVLGLLGELPSTIVKAIVDRPRPPGSVEVEAIGSVASYPSGHTVRAVVIAGLLVAAYAWPRRGRLARAAGVAVALTVVALVGVARVASGQHWPTDVVGGLLLGGAWLVICLLVARLLDARRRPAKATPPAG